MAVAFWWTLVCHQGYAYIILGGFYYASRLLAQHKKVSGRRRGGGHYFFYVLVPRLLHQGLWVSLAGRWSKCGYSTHIVVKLYWAWVGFFFQTNSFMSLFWKAFSFSSLFAERDKLPAIVEVKHPITGCCPASHLLFDAHACILRLFKFSGCEWWALYSFVCVCVCLCDNCCR